MTFFFTQATGMLGLIRSVGMLIRQQYRAARAMGSSSVQPSGDYVHYDFTRRHGDGIGILDVQTTQKKRKRKGKGKRKKEKGKHRNLLY